MTVASPQPSASLLADFLDASRRLVVLTGAGCSTEPGIPDLPRPRGGVEASYRFAKEAHRRGLPLALLNLGRTRADAEAGLKLEASCGELLPAALDELGIG